MNPKLNQIYSQIPESTCPPNCGKCCGVVTPSKAELRNIQDYCHQKNIRFKQFNNIFSYIGCILDCPYLLQDKSCEIYPVRPYLCRVMGVSDLKCPLNKCTSTKILNHSESKALYKYIYLIGKEKPRTKKISSLVKEVLRKL